MTDDDFARRLGGRLRDLADDAFPAALPEAGRPDWTPPPWWRRHLAGLAVAAVVAAGVVGVGVVVARSSGGGASAGDAGVAAVSGGGGPAIATAGPQPAPTGSAVGTCGPAPTSSGPLADTATLVVDPAVSGATVPTSVSATLTFTSSGPDVALRVPVALLVRDGTVVGGVPDVTSSAVRDVPVAAGTSTTLQATATTRSCSGGTVAPGTYQLVLVVAYGVDDGGVPTGADVVGAPVEVVVP